MLKLSTIENEITLLETAKANLKKCVLNTFDNEVADIDKKLDYYRQLISAKQYYIFDQCAPTTGTPPPTAPPVRPVSPVRPTGAKVIHPRQTTIFDALAEN